MSSPPSPSTSCKPGIAGLLDCGAGSASSANGESADTFFAALVSSLASFGVQFLVFIILRMRLARIYRPRTYLVSERERVFMPPGGLFGWLIPLFKTSNLEFIQKCGLDAYFFLRYLRMLIKIFLPMAIVLLPILLPINRYSGGDGLGLNKISISNISAQYKGTRTWAHCILALGTIVWICYVMFRELRGYIRVRQAFLTSPQHRIRASATTVLVSGIPRKWLTQEALEGLYDVFPGGIRNIWINRNFDELDSKVSYRNSVAKSLEGAETSLVRKCFKKHAETVEEQRKKEGGAKKTKQEQYEDDEMADMQAEQLADGQGVSSGDQHQTRHDLREAVQGARDEERQRRDHDNHEDQERRRNHPFGIMGQGFGAIGQGFENLGRGMGKVGKNVVGEAEGTVDAVNRGVGFVLDDELYRRSIISESSIPPTPPPKSPMAHDNPFESPSGQAAAPRRPFPSPTTAHVRAGASTNEALGQSYSSANSGSTKRPDSPSMHAGGPSTDSKPRLQMQISVPESHQKPHKWWQVWKSHDESLPLPSPQPHTAAEDEFPLNAKSAAWQSPNAEPAVPDETDVSGSKWGEKVMFWKEKQSGETNKDGEIYPEAYNKAYDEDQDGEPRWRRYIEFKDRPTMRMPVFSPSWCPSLPLIGKKVDKIYWLRRELARLNLEIEMDQQNVEKFPLMNSAFIQFNHQVAAHMACQSLSHHIPQHMAPRLVEVSPDDIIWSNMSIKWWERYLRTSIVLAICAAMIVFYAIPVSFTSLLNNISSLAKSVPWLGWLAKLPATVISIIQGILPMLIINVILMLVPIIFRMLVKQQGVPTGNAQELGVQQWYFAFLFIQVFLVVTITGGILQAISNIASNPASILDTLSKSLPKASNYFFSYLTVQALSNSASALLQTGALVVWFLLAPILDSTARAKWRRQTNLSNVQWGTFFPPFTNFAVIGIIFSIIAPLMLVFLLIIFGLFWIVYRYNVLHVYQFHHDTGGLLFPTAVNQLFTGIYVMELCLTGYFFIPVNGSVAALGQAIVMIIALVSTIAYQWLLNMSFAPLFQYLPITLEDEAVIRDEEFTRAQESKFAPLAQREDANDERDIQDVLEEREVEENAAEERAIDNERADIEARKRSGRQTSLPQINESERRTVTADRSSRQRSRRPLHNAGKNGRLRRVAPQATNALTKIRTLAYEQPSSDDNPGHDQSATHQDIEAQKAVGDVLFSGFADELEDLTPDDRDVLVRYAFQHSALRAERPVIWIPGDRLGVSDDEIRRTKKMSTVRIEQRGDDPGDDDHEKIGPRMVEKTNIWMSNEGTALDAKGKVVFRRSPPDFSNVQLIAL